MNGLFTDNFVWGNGAALFLFEDGIADTALLKDNAVIQNSTFAFNTVVDSNDATGGGAIYVSAVEPRGTGVALPVSSVLTSSIVWLNTTLSNATPIAGPGATTAGLVFQDTRLLVLASDVMYPGGTYPPFNPSFASINVDPIFVNNASRDLRLQGNSLCIDFGPLTVVDLPRDFPDMNGVSGTTDQTPYEFYGPRIRVVNVTPDIGCHEHQGVTP
ncbi:MAG: hypothetical protein DRJ50_13640 [Actinobacteria bacterium]|nr:MAG: hypothetical protein DRJ50_13640 [Actinomycetota bacterium]